MIEFSHWQLTSDERLIDCELNRFFVRTFNLPTFRMVRFKWGTFSVGYYSGNGRFLEVWALPVNKDGEPYLTKADVEEVRRRTRPRNLHEERELLRALDSEAVRSWESCEGAQAKIFHDIRRRAPLHADHNALQRGAARDTGRIVTSGGGKHFGGFRSPTKRGAR